MKKLYLASKSSSRRYLLNEVRIPFEVIGQEADEQACDWTLPIEQVVLQIARFKMKHALLPQTPQDGEPIFVLTADTLCLDFQGHIHGKPLDYDDAVAKVKLLRHGSTIVSAFCLEKKIWTGNRWQTIGNRERVVQAECLFDVPDNWINIYFKNHPLALQAAGALAIEEYGLQFLKSINGEYSTIIGLPLVELREALYELDFFVS